MLLIPTVAAAMTIAHVAAAPPRFLNERHAFIRGERAVFRLSVDGRDARVAFDTSGWLPARVRPVKGVARYTLDTRMLRAGDYDVRATVEKGPTVCFPITIAPERNPQRYPLWAWGGRNRETLKWWADRGYNGICSGGQNDPLDEKHWRTRYDALTFDDAARAGMDAGFQLYPTISERWKKDTAGRIVLPDGSVHANPASLVYPRDPVVLQHARDAAASYTRRYADYPSMTHAFIMTEYEVPFNLSEQAKRLAKEEAGIDLAAALKPPWADVKWAVIYPDKLPPALQPKDGVIPDDHPVYRALRWWWERGHGTSVYNAEMGKEVKKVRPDILTWHDPYRLSPVYRSHSGLDAISTWTYGFPDILRLCYPLALEAAAKRDHQKTMQTITLYVYAEMAMAVAKSTATPSRDFGGVDDHFNQGPDYATEALWLVTSYRPDILCIYNPGDRFPDGPVQDTWRTSPATFDAIGEVSRLLIEPYGPAILECRRPKPRVAVLMSAVAGWFPSGRKWYAYDNEQFLPYATLLMRNHVSFDVLLDDDIVEGRLKDYDTLVIPRGDTLTASMHQRIVEFARSGKRVLATTHLRAEVPGAVRSDFDFGIDWQVDGRQLTDGKAMTAEDHRARLEQYAKELAPHLSGITRDADADNQRVILNQLDGGAARYTFVINDDKTYGPRFGRWKLHMEAGVPQLANVRLAIQGRPALYDALMRREVTYTEREGYAQFDLELPAAGGALIAALPEKITKPAVALPTACTTGKPFPIEVRVLAASGKPIAAALPIRVEITDPNGRANEYSRAASTGATTGSVTVPFVPALNDAAGEWTVRVTDLLAGTVAESKFRVGHANPAGEAQ